MKVSRQQRADNRAAILDVASRLFRERGPDGVGVAEITKAAGLTHGGFYGHFASKEALLAEALTSALTSATEQLAEAGTEGLARYAHGYASQQHLRDRAGGCAVAALSGDVARQSEEVRASYAASLRGFLDAATTSARDRRTALAAFSTLAGAMIMARALAGTDDALAEELLAAALSQISAK